ncbi:MAG: amino acid ABC transporter permease [Thermomicrobiales bacterium]|nr:amino acid ABC transporter permease [Thermomicrobiales bacterium]
MYDLDWGVVLTHRDAFLSGLWLALRLAAWGLGFGSLIGLALAFARVSGSRPVSALAAAYVEALRNVPLLLLLFMIYFGLPIFAVKTFPPEIAGKLILDGSTSAIVGLALYAGAYLGEVFRGGILAVGHSYREAARSLGLTGWGVARYVTLPIMLRTVFPSLGNTFISLFKDTSLASAIAVPELTFATRELSSDTFRVIEAWAAGGALYLATSFAIALILRAMERRIRWSV